MEKKHAGTSLNPAKQPVTEEIRMGQYLPRRENETPETSKFRVAEKETIAASPWTTKGGEMVFMVMDDAIAVMGAKLL